MRARPADPFASLTRQECDSWPQAYGGLGLRARVGPSESPTRSLRYGTSDSDPCRRPIRCSSPCASAPRHGVSPAGFQLAASSAHLESSHFQYTCMYQNIIVIILKYADIRCCMISDDIIAYTRICQNMKIYLMISFHTLVYTSICSQQDYILYIPVYCISRYIPVYDCL